jgi:hypothetical protein
MSLFLGKLRIGRLTCWFFSLFSNSTVILLGHLLYLATFVLVLYIYEMKLIIMNLSDWMLITSINKFRYNHNIV